MPPVVHVHERVPVSKVGLSGDHRCEEHDVPKGDGHAAASKRVVHVLRVAEDDPPWSAVRLARQVGGTSRTYARDGLSIGPYGWARAAMRGAVGRCW